jgi:excisionase family DNA binding protein
MITDIRLSISEASKLFGISQRTIRRAIAVNALDFTLVQGRYKISFESILRWSQTSSLTIQKRDTHGIGQYVSAWKISTAPLAPQTNTQPAPKAPRRTKAATPAQDPIAPETKPAEQPIPAPAQTPGEPTLSWD